MHKKFLSLVPEWAIPIEGPGSPPKRCHFFSCLFLHWKFTDGFTTHQGDKYVKIFASSQIFICNFENLGKGLMGPPSQQNRFLLLLPIKWVLLMDSGQIWPRAGFWTQILFWQIFSLLWIKLCERQTFFHFWTRFFDIFSLFLKLRCTIVTQDLPNIVSAQNYYF